MGQRLIKVLDQPTMDGFVYRVDMRLRPFGDSGPLVLSFSALEDYYREQGRDWERYAMVKARIMGMLTVLTSLNCAPCCGLLFSSLYRFQRDPVAA